LLSLPAPKRQKTIDFQANFAAFCHWPTFEMRCRILGLPAFAQRLGILATLSSSVRLWAASACGFNPAHCWPKAAIKNPGIAAQGFSNLNLFVSTFFSVEKETK
jgi:hypothetical protein